jgi:hypothetical protein
MPLTENISQVTSDVISKVKSYYESGDRFGRLMLTGKCYVKKGYVKVVETICDCGNGLWVDLVSLKRDKTHSCGCIRIEEFVQRNTTHGMTIGNAHPLYKIWQNIISRCENKTTPSYKYYGGRGVKICDEWRNNFKSFYDWAIANNWQRGLEIDKDKKGNSLLYSPETCLILTSKENQKYKRSNVIIEAFGEKKRLVDWGLDSRCSIKAKSINIRLKNGWNAEDAISKPPIEKDKRYLWAGSKKI